MQQKKETVTVPKARSGWAKWGSRFWTFLAMGGFILIIFLIAGIVLAVSLLTKGC